MLTKGVIQSIDFASNKCTVRIPVFETAGNKETFEASATISTLPGVYNGYKVGDVVVVGFGPGGAGDCVIIGKLYLGVSKETQNEGGSVHCSDFIATNSACLPANTSFDFSQDQSKIKNSEIQPLEMYSSLIDLTAALSNNTVEINKLKALKKLASNSDRAIGYWSDDRTIWQRTITLTTIETIIDYLSSTTCWIDLSLSFISNSTNKIIRPLADYTIDCSDIYKIKITIPTLAANETANITLNYVR